MKSKSPLSHNDRRKHVWTKAWCATVNALNCSSPVTATRYADEALKAFDERFPDPTKIAIEKILEEHKTRNSQ